jgi:hypothetical protein
MFNNAKTMRKENKKLAKEKAKNLRARSKTFIKGTLGQCKVSAKKGVSGVSFYYDPNEIDVNWVYEKLANKGFSVDLDEQTQFIEINW